MSIHSETSLINAMLVVDDVMIHGSLRIVEGRIAEISEGSTSRSMSTSSNVVDCEGDIVCAGLIEIHTDALEWHLRPRPQSVWPEKAAVVGHDAVLASCGITTVLDSLRVGDLGSDGFRAEILFGALGAIAAVSDAGFLRVDHQLHLRCEVADDRTPGLFDQLSHNPLLRLVSLMDHTPGGRQYTDVDNYRRAVLNGGGSDAEADDKIKRLQDRQANNSLPNWLHIAASACALGVPLASHDDATLDDVALAVRSGVTISEFPTTRLAAAASRNAGLVTAAGAPNIVRGGSHSGNVSAAELAGAELLDIITSDYVPYSLLHAPFFLAHQGILTLPAALALVTSKPAEAVGLNDRGRIAVGKRADLVWVRSAADLPIVRGVFVEGRRVG